VRKDRRNPPLPANQMADLALTRLGTQHIQRIAIDIAHTTKKHEKQHLLLLVEWLTTFGMVDISIDFSLNSPRTSLQAPQEAYRQTDLDSSGRCGARRFDPFGPCCT
jgi:hypothetical protein